jgi:hypothetical protein
MEKLFIKEDKSSPLVNLDPETGVFEIRGNSFLDNAYEFYNPIIEWIKNYIQHPQKETNIIFDIRYINTSSQRMVFDFLKKTNQLYKNGNKVFVQWLYDENDDDLRDVGNDLLSFMEFPYNVLVKVS